MTAYHYWQNQPGCSPNDIPTLPTRARHVTWLRQGLTPNIAPTTTLSQVMAGRDFNCIQGLPTPPQPFSHTCIFTHASLRPSGKLPVLLCLLRPNRTHLRLRHNLPTPVNASSKTWSSERNAPHLIYRLNPLTGRKSC